MQHIIKLIQVQRGSPSMFEVHIQCIIKVNPSPEGSPSVFQVQVQLFL